MATQDEDEQLEHFEIYDRVRRECEAMLRRYLGRGMTSPRLPISVIETVAAASPDTDEPAPSLRELYTAHRKLVEAVAPAQPNTLLLIESKAGGHLQVPLVRHLLIIAGVSLAAVLLIGISPLVDSDPTSGDPLLSSGWPLLVNQAYFLFAALLGASFHALFTVKKYVTDGNYDPTYRSTYYIRLFLGMMAGLIMSSLVEIDIENSMRGVGRPLIALLGGFSSSAIYRILQRLVMVLETTVVGSEATKSDAKGKPRDPTQEAETDAERATVASNLVKIQSLAASGASAAQMQAALSRLAADVLQGDVSTPSTTDEANDEANDSEAG